MGATQTQWLGQQLAASQATWQVLGQQVLMGRMELPAPLLMDILSPGSGVSLPAYAALLAKAQQVVTEKYRQYEELASRGSQCFHPVIDEPGVTQG